MTLYQPVYRLTMYAPRSVDPDEATVLTPRSGAGHSDAFQLTTQSGVSGWQPYLGQPEGRSGKIDFRTRKRTVGSYTFRLLDPNLGSSMVVRWLTEFTGNDAEQPQLLGNLVYVQQSTDGGSTFTPYIVGRCQNHSLESLTTHGIQIRDGADDFKKFRLFTHRARASYAIEPLVVPLGLSAAFGDAVAAVPLTGTIRAATAAVPYRLIEVNSAGRNRLDNLVTQALVDEAGGSLVGRHMANLLAVLASGGLGHLSIIRGLRVRFSSTSPSITDKELHVRRIYVAVRGSHIVGTPPHLTVTHLVVDALRSQDDSESLATTDPYYQAFDTGTVPTGTVVTFTVRLLRLESGSDDARGDLYLGNVTVPQHWMDVLDGEFSRTYEVGDAIPSGRAVGDPVWTVPYDAAAFAALATPVAGREALPIMRGHVTKAWDGFEYIERVLCQPYGLGYRFEPVEVSGQPVCQLVPLDFRLPNTTALGSLPTLTDTDLVLSEDLGWNADAEKAITLFTTRYYSDVLLEAADLVDIPDRVPDVPPSLLFEATNRYVDPQFGRFLDLGYQEMEVDAIGIRGADAWSDVTENTQQDVWADAQARGVGEHYRPFYGAGVTEVSFTCVRNATTAALREGDWVICGFSGWPNPSTNQRGGNRLILLTGYTDQGARITFTGMDAGVSSGAGVPTIGTPTQTTGYTAHSIDVVVTLNAAGAIVQLRYAVTATSYGTTPPDDDDPAWLPSLICRATGTYRITGLPSGKRIFVAGSSRPNKNGTKRDLPSAWAKPSGTKYVDTASYTAPSSVSVSPDPVTGTATCTATWTNGEASLPVELWLDDGGGYVLADRLPAGSVSYILNPFLTAGASYTLGVRHVDTLGGASAYGTDTFSVDGGAGGPALTAPTITLLQGSL